MSTEIYAMLLTPMLNDRRRTIDYLRLTAEIGWCASYKIDGLVIAPSIGEAPHLRDEERKQVFKECIGYTKERHPNLKMIAMTTHCDTWQVIDFANYAKELGYHGQQLTPPYYWRIGEKGVLRHYKLTWEESRLPIVLYHNPGLSKVEMRREFIGQLVGEIPNGLIGVKETETDPYTQLVKLFEAVNGRVPIYTTFRAFAWGLLLGARGGFINAPTLPACVKLAKLFDEGETEKMIELQKAITLTFPQKGERNEDAISLTKAMGSIVMNLDMGPVREPYLPASDEFAIDFRKKYEKLEKFMAGL